MRHLPILCAAAVSFGSVGSAPVFAQTAPAAPQAAKATPDPNEVVCEKEEETGSRLGAAKVCKTRAQWAEERRLNRATIDKVQMERGCAGEGKGSC